jgi:predicted alpha/beta superfamily hydrolase
MMKKLLLLISIFFISVSFYAQNIQIKNFESYELENNRSLKIYVPPSYHIDSTKIYPLAIVLDAEFLFDVYVANAILFAKTGEAPEQIIVGIDQNQYNERYEDCSYSKENSLPTIQGEAFYRFVRSELFNYFEENYRISPFKTIVGRTLTANFINYFLIENYPSFNAYININPYYAMDMPSLIQEKVSSLKDENIYYYLSNSKFNSEKRQTPIKTTNALLETTENSKFKFKYDTFNNSTKTASIGQSISSALSFIFTMYSAISKEEFEKEIKDLSPPDAIEYLENKYVEIEYLFGSNLKIREKDIFAIESIILDKENGDYLRNFGEMINGLYKESPIGDYYIGRYYETGNKLKQALNYFKSGYMKLPEGDPNADAYYQNIERVLAKKNGTYIEPEIKN